ncbi:maleylpyruvate isomerase family mycothiol-dependent enzyme [Microlunatus panaciterrae]|uniref:Maleylpyruvate isomerase n=1 Tax=Microlunatus panaciterrae TaxID=400768 RepID=A0ABS2RQ01_9ACTN|nr:maleylpyruvate isomerase family mycothiol-dependent enzyme [Microlunatus panaciterrae]MBM7800236.1 maleylpyruvate isomerase [Microlunatus panaciterrae]
MDSRDVPAEPEKAATEPGSRSDLHAVRSLVTHATQRLLGDTIAVTDEQWSAPSRLPDWSRAHVGTHLARQADALVRLTDWARTGQPTAMYASGEQRDAEIAAGAGRTGLEIQIDLDTTADHLAEAFEALDEAAAWDTEVELRGGQTVRARLLPLARLGEVLLHHVDLDIGFEVADIDDLSAEWLLEWFAFRLGQREGFPALRLTADSGHTVSVGDPSTGQPSEVSGPGNLLLGWLTGRLAGSQLAGAEGITLPPL